MIYQDGKVRREWEEKKLIARQDSNTRPQDLEASVLPLRYNRSPSPVKLNKSLIRVKGLQVYRLITFLTYIGCGVILKCPFMSLSQRPLTSIDVDGDTRRRIVRPPWKGIHQACEALVTLISLHSRKMEAGCEQYKERGRKMEKYTRNQRKKDEETGKIKSQLKIWGQT